MIRIDDEGPTIRIEGAGFFSEDELRRHFDALATIVAHRRHQRRQIVALVDLRQAATQSMIATQLIAEACERIFCEPSDRVALVVSTLLSKLQNDRIHHHQGFRTWLSAEAAEHFLREGPQWWDDRSSPDARALARVRPVDARDQAEPPALRHPGRTGQPARDRL